MSRPSPARWRRAIWLLRLAGTAAGVAYVAYLVDPGELAGAVSRLPPLALGIAVLLVAANVAAGALRWRVLLRAYGATSPPPLGRLVHLYFVAFFYNNYLPGAVAGDVIRGVATREAFGEHGMTATLTVVLVERALGLFGLFALLAIGLVTADAAATGGNGQLWLWTAVGVGGALAIIAVIAFARRLTPYLRGRLATLAGRLPAIVDAPAFAAATALSVATQGLIALAGWVLLAALDPGVDLASSLLVVPLASATTFLPITVGGAGAREAVFVELCARLFHMPASSALVASLALWIAHLAVGAAGLIAQLAARERAPRTDAA